MRAAVLTQFNQPWELRDLPVPTPGAGQVAIRVRASGLCGTDLHAHHGYLPGLQAPIVCGHEPAGEISALGAGVTHLRVGDRVGVSWLQRGCGRCRACQQDRALNCPEQQSWMNLGGGNAEVMLAWASGCTLIPEGLAFELAAPIFCAGYTAYSGLRTGAPAPGDRVAVLGIGGLGHLAVQFAKARGLEVVAVTGTESKRAEARALGADEVVLAGDDVGRSLMAAGGADVILSTSNSAAQVSQAVGGLRPDGRLVNMGVLDGPLQVGSIDLMFPQRRILGSTQLDRRDLVEALELTAAGRVKPLLELYPLDQINEVRERLAAGKVRYRAVLQHRAAS